MKTYTHSNGWTIIIDEKIQSLSDIDIFNICRMIVSNMVVVFKNQNLTPEQELNFCRTIGKVQPTETERSKHINLVDGILRVTGEKNKYGEPGLFGHKAALDWHCNQPSNENRKPLIWLYGKSGTLGSKTSWLNNILAYEDLSKDIQSEIEDIKIYCGYKSGLYSDSIYFRDHVNKTNPQSLVHTNKSGKKGLFFPFLQIFGFENKDQKYFEKMLALLINHVNNEKYMYHHLWEDGDVVISEQWLSIHKRWEFDNMEKRILHRIAFDYSNVYD